MSQGKGSNRRPTDEKKYGDNYDGIFRNPNERMTATEVERLTNEVYSELFINILSEKPEVVRPNKDIEVLVEVKD